MLLEGDKKKLRCTAQQTGSPRYWEVSNRSRWRGWIKEGGRTDGDGEWALLSKALR